MRAQAIRPFSGRINRNQANKVISSARETYRKVWASACQYDVIPIDSMFVVFSDDNPFVPFIDKAYIQLRQIIVQYQQGGYIGLKIQSGKPNITLKQRYRQLREQLAAMTES